MTTKERQKLWAARIAEKENGLNPFNYLKYLFEKLPNKLPNTDIQDQSAIDEGSVL